MTLKQNIQPVDQGAEILKILLPQYAGTTVEGLHQHLVENTYQDIEDQALQICNMCDLTKSTGNVLDAAGSLIGLPRMAVRVSSGDYWQLDVTPFTNHEFADKEYLIYEEATDEMYINAIKSYAYTQTSYGSLPDLLATLQLLMGIDLDDDSRFSITQTGVFNVNVSISGTVSEPIKYLIEDYITPNGSFLTARVIPCVYNFTFTG